MFFSSRKNITQLTDLELIDLFKKKGDNHHVGVLFKRYAHLVFGVCLKYLKDEEQAKDMVMQVFEKLIKTLHKHEVSNFKSWLHVLTKNECLMQLRKTKRLVAQHELQPVNADFMESTMVVHPNIEEDDLEDDITKLESCIAGLKEAQGVCIRAFYLEKKTYEEISLMTGFELKKVKSYIQNGRRNLKICIERSRDSA